MRDHLRSQEEQLELVVRAFIEELIVSEEHLEEAEEEQFRSEEETA
jgi:hypothetical protein